MGQIQSRSSTQPAVWAPRGYEDATVSTWRMDDRIDYSLVRLWCEVVEDRNPLYHDVDIATAHGHAGLIAPPAMVLTWTFAAEWRPRDDARTAVAHFRDELPELPHSIGLRSKLLCARPLLHGEQFTVYEFVSPPGELTQTPRGVGRKQLRYRSVRDDAGTEVASVEFETLRLRFADRPDEGDDALAPMPHFHGTAVASPGLAAPGELLAPMHMRISRRRCIRWVAASRDFFDVHHDPTYARQTGARDLYLGVHFFQALVGRYVTDWTGPNGLVRRLEFTQLGRCYPDETVNVIGRIAATADTETQRIVDLEVAIGTERGKLYDVRAQVSLDLAR